MIGIFLFLHKTKLMRLKIIATVLLTVVLFSCGAKLAVSAMKHDTVQVPPKLASLPEEKPKPEDFYAGKSLYENNCAKCHKLYGATEFSKADWQPVLIKMQKKAHLDNIQMASISYYIYSQL